MLTWRFGILVICIAVLTACNSPNPSPSQIPNTPYPGFNTQPAPQAYPGMAVTGAYPAPTFSPTHVPGAVPFRLNKPLSQGDTQVSGTGPAGIPISLEDVTFMGTLLGQTTVLPDGTFVFQVAPLEKDHRLGIALGILTGTSWNPEDFNAIDYQGSEFQSIPNVGYFFDTALVLGP